MSLRTRVRALILGAWKFNSGDYWETRYRAGGTSGLGSYNQLAEYKAEFLNRFVAKNHIQTVAELGCGDGAQLSLAGYAQYVGYDVSRTAVALCRERFASDPTKQFIRLTDRTPVQSADLMLSLDVIYHLVEDDVFERYMQKLFGGAGRFVIIYSSNKDEMTNDAHVRHRQFTKWVSAERQDFTLSGHAPNRYPHDPQNPDTTTFADFYVFRRLGR